MKVRFLGASLMLLMAAALVALNAWGCAGGGTNHVGPTVVSVTPKNDAVGVPTASLITATFNTDMLPSSLTTASFSASAQAPRTPARKLAATPPGANGALPGTVTVNGLTATLTLSAPMPPNTLITCTLTTAIANMANQHMAQNYVWSFTTGNNGPAPTVVSTVPASLATGVSLSGNVTATFSEAMNPATITGQTFTLAGPNGTAIPTTVTYANDVATLDPTAPLLQNTVYTATVTAGVQSSVGTPMAANYKWTFTTATTDVAPTVVSTIPTSLATGVSLSAKVSATFSEAMNPATITGTTFTLAGPGGTAIPATVTYSNNVATLDPTAPLLQTTVYTATVTTGVTDVAGTPLANNYKWTFTTATTDIAPTVVSTVPIPLAVGVSLSSKVSATFSEAMNANTINGTTFTLAGPNGTDIAATVTYANDVATLDPTVPLLQTTVYTATVTTGVTDVAGTPMAANYKWTFTTATTDIPPTVISTIPAALAANVPLNTRVSATFSEAMNATSINGTTFTLTPSGGTAVAATVTYLNDVATLVPNAPLVGNTVYTATVTTGVTDVAGTPMAANFNWTFTTDASPTVISTTPLNTATQVGIKDNVTATFSKAMAATSITGTTFTLTAKGVGVTATVTYANGVATLTPAAPLAGTTLYTATVTTGATDLLGTPLANNFVWTFTTGLAGINLGTAGTYGVLAGSTVTNTGATIINGDLGVSPGTAITGFPPGTFTGTLHAGDAVAAKAKADLLAAYTDAVGLQGGNALAGDISGLTITPGLYSNSSSVMVGVGSNVTFDAKGDPNAVFILQMGSTLTTGVGSTMTLVNGAQAGNIYWAVGSSATLGVSSTIVGTVLAQASITANTGTVVQGRLLTNVAAVSLADNSVVVPPFNPAKNNRRLPKKS